MLTTLRKQSSWRWLRIQPGHHPRIPLAPPQFWEHHRVDQEHGNSRGTSGSRSKGSSSCGRASRCSASEGAAACSHCRSRSYSAAESTTLTHSPRRVTFWGFPLQSGLHHGTETVLGVLKRPDPLHHGAG